MNIDDLMGNSTPEKVSIVQPLVPSFDFKLPKIEPKKDFNLASEFRDRLVTMLNDFNRSLDDEDEVGLQLCNFGQTHTIYINDIGYWNPSLIVFFGIDMVSKNPVDLIQHVSQINVLLVKVPKLVPDQPKRPIGFQTWEEFDKSKITE